ncbi:MAG: hypothetical protein JWN99_951 [Ilumatobacteraceae bacterium]|nr:hypothetical protein [Ilumatobacteraceae bacterium]
MTARPIVCIVAAILACSLVVACGSDDPSGSPDVSVTTTLPLPASESRACSLTTTEEVGNVIGVVPVANAEVDAGGVLTCTFTGADQVEMARIAITTLDADPVPRAVYDQFAATDGSEVVPGFGDKAVWAAGALHVQTDHELVTFTIAPQKTLENGEAVRSATLELAGLAMARYTII